MLKLKLGGEALGKAKPLGKPAYVKPIDKNVNVVEGCNKKCGWKGIRKDLVVSVAKNLGTDRCSVNCPRCGTMIRTMKYEELWANVSS